MGGPVIELYESLSGDERAVIVLLRAQARGAARALTQVLIARCVGFPERRVRTAIKSLAETYHYPIAASYRATGGYYIPNTAAEMNVYVSTLRRHWLAMKRRLDEADKKRRPKGPS